MRLPTIRDVAREAGVSISTVSLVLRQPHRVSEHTRVRVEEVIRTLNFRPNGTARDLRVRKSGTVGVFLRNLSGPYYSELIGGIEQVATSLRLTPIVCGRSVHEEQGSLRLLRERRIDGAIVLDFGITLQELAQYAGPDLPVVVLNRTLPDPLASAYMTGVKIDDDGGGYQAGKHFIEQGFLHPAVITGPVEAEASQARQRGFFRAYAEHGIASTSVLVIHGDFTEESGAKAMETILNLNLAIDAVFSANDQMALGVLQVLAKHNMRVEQIAVMGFDDISLARYVQPALTTVHQPMFEVGSTAMELLGQAMQGKERIPPRTLATRVVIRSSTPKKPSSP